MLTLIIVNINTLFYTNTSTQLIVIGTMQKHRSADNEDARVRNCKRYNKISNKISFQ